MKFLDMLKGLLNHASGVRNTKDVKRRDDGCGIHTFPSRRERALFDLRRVRMLVEAQESQSGGTSDCCANDSIRELIPSLGELVSKRTGESLVYWNAAEDAYYKVKNPAAKAPLKNTSEKDWPYEHIIHNILFPETRYELVAIGRELKELRIVLKQRCISSEQFPSDEEVEDYLRENHGLVREDRFWFGNDLFAITDVGARGDNVLKGDDGLLYFIDPLIRLKKPALEVISGLVGLTQSERK